MASKFLSVSSYVTLRKYLNYAKARPSTQSENFLNLLWHLITHTLGLYSPDIVTVHFQKRVNLVNLPKIPTLIRTQTVPVNPTLSFDCYRGNTFEISPK